MGVHSDTTIPLPKSVSLTLVFVICNSCPLVTLAANKVPSFSHNPIASPSSSTSPVESNLNNRVSSTKDTTRMSTCSLPSSSLTLNKSVMFSMASISPTSSKPTPLRTLRRLPSLNAPLPVTNRACPEEKSLMGPSLLRLPKSMTVKSRIGAMLAKVWITSKDCGCISTT